MWLLNTSTAELEFFHRPERVPGGYAILSHVWEGDEQTFSELRALQEECAKSNTKPRDSDGLSPKIRAFCELARTHGHKWGWADMCCIDKSSSAELSEAINSMYRYYSMADVCYAYLCDVDVPAGQLLRDVNGWEDAWERSLILSTEQRAFNKSRWHRRGWTLQELVASDVVFFVSRKWHILGTKVDLPNLVADATGIPQEVLTLIKEPAEFSIAQRMSWAAGRETTRPEDEAYCLMGIFDVNMPTLYGEGRRAFRRLQEEIMKKSVDTSLFAWDAIDSDNRSPEDAMEGNIVMPEIPAQDALELEPELSNIGAASCPMDHIVPSGSLLFANTPRVFNRGSSRVTCYEVCPRTCPLHRDTGQYLMHQWKEAMFHALAVPVSMRKLPDLTVTPYGVLASVMVRRAEPEGSKVSALLCIENSRTPGLRPKIILLQLVRCTEPQDRTRPLYHPNGLQHYYPVTNRADISKEFAWEEIYIIHEPSQPTKRLHDIGNMASPFRIRFLDLLRDVGVIAITPSELRLPWHGSPPLRLHFHAGRGSAYRGQFYVFMGCCTVSGLPVGAQDRWATVTMSATTQTHDCAVDHIDDWVGLSRLFSVTLGKSAELRVKLSFTLSTFPTTCVTRPLEPHVHIFPVRRAAMRIFVPGMSSLSEETTPWLRGRISASPVQEETVLRRCRNLYFFPAAKIW